MAKTDLAFEGAWKSPDHTVEVNVPLIIFEDGNSHIVYCPALDVSGYGADEDEAKASFETSLSEFILYTTRKKTINNVLTDMGWTIRNKNKPMVPPPFSKLLSENDNFRNIFDNYPFKKVDEDIMIPA